MYQGEEQTREREQRSSFRVELFYLPEDENRIRNNEVQLKPVLAVSGIASIASFDTGMSRDRIYLSEKFKYLSSSFQEGSHRVHAIWPHFVTLHGISVIGSENT